MFFPPNPHNEKPGTKTTRLKMTNTEITVNKMTLKKNVNFWMKKSRDNSWEIKI